MKHFKLDLLPGDFDRLILVIGYATGAAINQGNRDLALSFLDLANRINRDNPDWIPYKVPAMEK